MQTQPPTVLKKFKWYSMAHCEMTLLAENNVPEDRKSYKSSTVTSEFPKNKFSTVKYDLKKLVFKNQSSK